MKSELSQMIEDNLAITSVPGISSHKEPKKLLSDGFRQDELSSFYENLTLGDRYKKCFDFV